MQTNKPIYFWALLSCISPILHLNVMIMPDCTADFELRVWWLSGFPLLMDRALSRSEVRNNGSDWEKKAIIFSDAPPSQHIILKSCILPKQLESICQQHSSWNITSALTDAA
jgi:hypothetical protein